MRYKSPLVTSCLIKLYFVCLYLFLVYTTPIIIVMTVSLNDKLVVYNQSIRQENLKLLPLDWLCSYLRIFFDVIFYCLSYYKHPNVCGVWIYYILLCIYYYIVSFNFDFCSTAHCTVCSLNYCQHANVDFYQLNVFLLEIAFYWFFSPSWRIKDSYSTGDNDTSVEKEHYFTWLSTYKLFSCLTMIQFTKERNACSTAQSCESRMSSQQVQGAAYATLACMNGQPSNRWRQRWSLVCRQELLGRYLKLKTQFIVCRPWPTERFHSVENHWWFFCESNQGVRIRYKWYNKLRH